MPEWKSTKPPSDVNFEISRSVSPLQSREEAREDRSNNKSKWRIARRNRSELAKKAVDKHAPGAEARRAKDHNVGAWETEKASAKYRASNREMYLGTPKNLGNRGAPNSEIEKAGRKANERIADISNRNNRLTGSFPLSQNPGMSERDIADLRPAITRAKGAMLPPPHPKSLGEKMKQSPKAKRDAWRSNRGVGAAPHVIDLTDDHDLTKAPGWKRKLTPGEL